MDGAPERAIARLIARVERDPEVLAVILFGSRARGEASPESDFDVCLALNAERASRLAAAEKRLQYLKGADLDLVVFHQLPLHMRSRVLKEGKVLFVRDEDALYALAYHTARAFEDFRHIYREYLDQVARG